MKRQVVVELKTDASQLETENFIFYLIENGALNKTQYCLDSFPNIGNCNIGIIRQKENNEK